MRAPKIGVLGWFLLLLSDAVRPPPEKILVAVLSLEEAPRYKPLTVDAASEWSEVHEQLMRLFPEQLMDIHFRLLRFGTNDEVGSVRELSTAAEGARFLVDDTHDAAWLRGAPCMSLRFCC